jgi:hypothetical protein
MLDNFNLLTLAPKPTTFITDPAFTICIYAHCTFISIFISEIYCTRELVRYKNFFFSSKSYHHGSGGTVID